MPCTRSRSLSYQTVYGNFQVSSSTCYLLTRLGRNGPAIVQRQSAIEQTPYQQSLEQGLEPPQLTTDSVRYWSDFNRVYFHPKSIIQLNEYELNSSLMPFENWTAGDELFNSLDKEHDLLDRDLRPFVEEADQMQGIQLITGVDDAWGGFAARYMDRLRDEYGKTAIWVWAAEDSVKHVPQVLSIYILGHHMLTEISQEKRLPKLSNSARSISEIASQASLFIPMTIPSMMLPRYITIDEQSQWHVSGLLCTAMESASLPSRLKVRDGTRETLDQVTSALNINGSQNIAKLRMSIDQISLAVQKGSGHDQPGRRELRAQSGDMRIPSTERSTFGPQNTVEDDIAIFDMDFFPGQATEQTRTRQKAKAARTFGQVENYRDNEDQKSDIANEEDGGLERAHRRAAGLPILQKLVAYLFAHSMSICATALFRVSQVLVVVRVLISGNSCYSQHASAGHGYPCPFLFSIAFPAFSLNHIPLCRLCWFKPRCPRTLQLLSESGTYSIS